MLGIIPTTSLSFSLSLLLGSSYIIMTIIGDLLGFGVFLQFPSLAYMNGWGDIIIGAMLGSGVSVTSTSPISEVLNVIGNMIGPTSITLSSAMPPSMLGSGVIIDGSGDI